MTGTSLRLIGMHTVKRGDLSGQTRFSLTHAPLSNQSCTGTQRRGFKQILPLSSRRLHKIRVSDIPGSVRIGQVGGLQPVVYPFYPGNPLVSQVDLRIQPLQYSQDRKSVV